MQLIDFKRLVRPAGFEPTTLGFGGRYSIQLSYRRNVGVAILLAVGERRPAPRAYDIPWAAACNLRTVAQLRVVAPAPALRAKAMFSLLSRMPVEHHR